MNFRGEFMTVVLASQSPRRKELLEKCGVSSICDPADIDETMDLGRPLTEEIQNLAYRKAAEVLKRHPDDLIIGSDTIVVLNRKVLGKPQNMADAEKMLGELQGRTHEVMTGLCFLSEKRKYTDVSVSKVTFAPMSKEEIHAYASTGECLDKAGAYGIQGFGGRYISGIEGDYYTIMGLPLNLVYEELKNQNLY
jgi:septum formation protein